MKSEEVTKLAIDDITLISVEGIASCQIQNTRGDPLDPRTPAASFS
jgi:hypothetical protein